MITRTLFAAVRNGVCVLYMYNTFRDGFGVRNRMAAFLRVECFFVEDRTGERRKGERESALAKCISSQSYTRLCTGHS